MLCCFSVVLIVLLCLAFLSISWTDLSYTYTHEQLRRTYNSDRMGEHSHLSSLFLHSSLEHGDVLTNSTASILKCSQ